VGVEVRHVLRRQAGVLERPAHAPRGAGADRVRRGHVVRVGGDAGPDELGVDAGPPPLGVFRGLQND
jgi:hypothetical protein